MKQKTPDIGADARTQMKQTIPSAMKKAIEAYHNFVDENNAEQTNDFKNHHAAAKAALSHIELLVKLSDMVGAMDDETHNQLDVLIAEAKRELSGYDE